MYFIFFGRLRGSFRPHVVTSRRTIASVMHMTNFKVVNPKCLGRFDDDRGIRIETSLYSSFATTLSQLKMCNLSGETCKGFEVLQFSMSATATQLHSSAEFCKLRYDTVPINCASGNVSFYTNNTKMPNFEL